MISGFKYVSNISVDSHYAECDGEYYPYDCPRIHCPLAKDQCRNACCLEKLRIRSEEISATIIGLERETLQLRKDIDSKSQDVSRNLEDGFRYSIHVLYSWIKLISAFARLETNITHENVCRSTTPCEGCAVERGTRKCRMLRLVIAVQREQIKSLQEDIQVHHRDKDEL
jgi:hypothetical protein